MMNKHTIARWIFSLGLCLTGWATVPAWAQSTTFVIDEDHFSVAFLVDHIGYAKQLGQFLKGSGSFVYDPKTDNLEQGAVVIEADSVFTNHARRDRHLKGGDFLAVRDHATIRFVVSQWDGASQTLTGELTMLGQTHSVTLQATVNQLKDYPFGHGQPTLGISIRGQILRSQWGMVYGIEGGLVGDAVDVLIEFEAIAE
jgi:polyisoprenoid-binding protein YceI